MRTFSTDHKRALATWSLDCAERVLPLFESVRPDDDRPRGAVRAGRERLRTGRFSMAVIRQASLGAHAAAKEAAADAAAAAAAHAAGHAVATAHAPQHAYGGAVYALKAVAASTDGSLEAVLHERDWQEQHLPEGLRAEVMSRIVVEDRASGPFVAVRKGPGF